jgi:hypothetical protein
LGPFFSQTKEHLLNLANRYGQKITILNLLKKSEDANSEKNLSTLFEKFMEESPNLGIENIDLKYKSLDFLNYFENSIERLLEELEKLAKEFEEMGYFSMEENFDCKKVHSRQKGVIR